MNTLLHKLKNLGIPVVILLIVILGVIFILSNNSRSTTINNSTNEDTNQSAESENIKVIPVKDLTTAELADKQVKFSSSFFINSIVQSDKVSGVSCGTDGTSICIINFITDETDTYYLSTPLEPIALDGLERILDKAETFESSNGSIFLKYARINFVDDNGEPITDKRIVSQIYGCIQDNVCLGSGVLDTSNEEANAAAVAKFEEFVRSITIL